MTTLSMKFNFRRELCSKKRQKDMTIAQYLRDKHRGQSKKPNSMTNKKDYWTTKLNRIHKDSLERGNTISYH